MAASTPMGRMDSVPQATIEALLGMDTAKLDKLAKKQTELTALAGAKEPLLALAESADALLALIENTSETTSES